MSINTTTLYNQTTQHPNSVLNFISEMEQDIWAMKRVSKVKLREAILTAGVEPATSSNGINILSILAPWHGLTSQLVYEFDSQDELVAVHMLMLEGIGDLDARLFVLSLANLDLPSLNLRAPEGLEGGRESGLFADVTSSQPGWLRASIYLSCDA